MSHLHIPDGLLPVWLWVAGLVAASAAVGFSLFMLRKVDLRKKIPLLGMMSAMMLVGMSIEVVPYHFNLSVITGIILGPWLAIVAALIVNLLMALVGHGGITVVGLNTIAIGFEGVMGYILFTAFRKALRPGLSAAAATFLTLFMSTCLMLLIVFLGNIDLNISSAEELREVMEANPAGFARQIFNGGGGFNFRFFAIASFAMGLIGWTIEAFVTSVAVGFIDKVKPDIIGRRY
jgi:cobalt/nickel transport system permease protein